MTKSRRRPVRVTRLRELPEFLLSSLRVKNLCRQDEVPPVSVVQVTLPPKYTHSPLVHRRTDEWFIVLSGRGQGDIGGKRVKFSPGTIVSIPAGVPHTMGTGGSSMTVLAVFSPWLDASKKGADVHPVCPLGAPGKAHGPRGR